MLFELTLVGITGASAIAQWYQSYYHTSNTDKTIKIIEKKTAAEIDSLNKTTRLLEETTERDTARMEKAAKLIDEQAAIIREQAARPSDILSAIQAIPTGPTSLEESKSLFGMTALTLGAALTAQSLRNQAVQRDIRPIAHILDVITLISLTTSLAAVGAGAYQFKSYLFGAKV
jgi:hypothetical protein